MTGKDLTETSNKFSEWAKSRNVSRVLLLSPDAAQTNLARHIFPNAEIKVLYWQDYDIMDGQPPGGRYDVIMLANTMLCMPDAVKCFKNLLSSCNELWLQDVVRAWRTESNEVAGASNKLFVEGDYNRFSFSKHDEFARENTNANVFDLDTVSWADVIECHFYSDNGARLQSGDYKDCRKWLGILKHKSEY